MTVTANPMGNTPRQQPFAQVPGVAIPRSVFNRSCGVKTTFDAGWLIPIFVDEVLPGDTMNLRLFSVVRMSTPIFPVMDNMYMDTFFFFVPNRLLWVNWQKFCGEQDDPGDSIAFTVPQMTETPAEGSLSDYLGIPIGNSLTFNSLHHRAYNLIFKEWFRSEDLTDSPVVDTDNGPDTATDYVLRRRAKRHDYFTSCLPAPQKGTAVTLPLGTTAPVVAKNEDIYIHNETDATDRVLRLNATTGNVDAYAAPSGTGDARWGAQTGLETDLSTATAATINAIREAFQIQKLLERDARAGTRYVEILRSHFGITNHPDARLQRPEYLGGGSSVVNVTPVAATSQLAPRVVGELGGFGTARTSGVGFMKSFVEHGVIIGLVNVRADLTYQQGLHKMWSRQTRYEYYWPAFAHLGEQEVKSREIFADGTGGDDNTFGFQERWAEYRYKPSIVTGAMRSDAAAPLDPWHLALDFASRPTLNNAFIEDDPPMSRVIAQPTEPDFVGDFFFDYRCARPMPTFSVPGLVDHF